MKAKDDRLSEYLFPVDLIWEELSLEKFPITFCIVLLLHQDNPIDLRQCVPDGSMSPFYWKGYRILSQAN